MNPLKTGVLCTSHPEPGHVDSIDAFSYHHHRRIPTTIIIDAVRLSPSQATVARSYLKSRPGVFLVWAESGGWYTVGALS